jgi:hypothetical protein
VRRWWPAHAALLALAVAAGLGAGANVTDSPIPSAKNSGPHGLLLLSTYLSQTGHDVRLLETSLDALPDDLETLVLAAPEGHALSKEELARVDAFVRSGGTLVYLAARRSRVQRDLDEQLEVRFAPAPTQPITDTHPDDVLGITDPVRIAGGALANAKALRLVTDDSIEVDATDAVPVTAFNLLWWRKLGDGEVWIAAGPELAQAARLELDDNLSFWSALAARGPLGFDEVHQAPRPSPPLTANLWGSGLQLLFCALAFVLAFGARLGPPRPTPVERHRSSLEYIESMAALAREGCVPAELAQEQLDRLKRLELLPDGVALDPSSVRGPADFLAFSQKAAELEVRARGRSG